MKLVFAKKIHSSSGLIILIKYIVLFVILIIYECTENFRTNFILSFYLRYHRVLSSDCWLSSAVCIDIGTISPNILCPYPCHNSPSLYLSSSCPVPSSSYQEIALNSQSQELTFVFRWKADWTQENTAPLELQFPHLCRRWISSLNPWSPHHHLLIAYILHFPKGYTWACYF